MMIDIQKGYKDSAENGVVVFNGSLNICPTYQHEFIYGGVKRNKVKETVIKGYSGFYC